MEIKTLLTKRNYTSMKNKVNKYIVIHYVGAVSKAVSNAKYFENVYRGSSAHYFVDDNEIYQVVSEKDAAWHCGARYYKHLSCRNSNSIGIEMCCYRESNGELAISDKVVHKTIELTKELMKKYNIPVENVLRHFDVTGKNCPAPFVKDSRLWNQFRGSLNKNIDSNDNFKSGEYAELHLPVAVAFKEGNKLLVDDKKGQQFWIHESLVKDDEIVARVIIAFASSAKKYIVQVFDSQFWVDEENLKKY